MLLVGQAVGRGGSRPDPGGPREPRAAPARMRVENVIMRAWRVAAWRAAGCWARAAAVRQGREAVAGEQAPCDRRLFASPPIRPRAPVCDGSWTGAPRGHVAPPRRPRPSAGLGEGTQLGYQSARKCHKTAMPRGADMALEGKKAAAMKSSCSSNWPHGNKTANVVRPLTIRSR